MIPTRAPVPMLLILALLACSCSSSGAGDDVRSRAGVDGTNLEKDLAPQDSIASAEVHFDAAADQVDVEAVPLEPFRFAVISDTHFTASGSHPSNKMFQRCGEELSRMTPPVELVVNAGDNVDDLYVFPQQLETLSEIPVLRDYRSAIEQFYPRDYLITIGNHDNRFFDTFEPDLDPLGYWLDTFKDTGSLPSRYYSVDFKGFRLVFLDCTDEAFDHESNDRCLVGQTQLAWLDEVLTTDLPCLLFWHIEIVPEAGPDGGHPLLAAIYPHRDRIRAVFMGHSHRFLRVVWQGIPFLSTDTMKDRDEPVFHLLECDPVAGTIEVVNEADIDYSVDSVR